MEEEEDNSFKSQLLINAEQVYDKLKEQSRETIDGLIWEGYLAALVSPYGNYTYIVNALKEMGCIEQLRRGGGSTQSAWLIITPPTRQLLSKVSKRRGPNSVKTATSAINAVTTLEGRVAELERKVELITRHIEPIVKAFIAPKP